MKLPCLGCSRRCECLALAGLALRLREACPKPVAVAVLQPFWNWLQVCPPSPVMFPLAPSFSPTTIFEVPHAAFVQHGVELLLLRLYTFGPSAGRTPSKHQKSGFFPHFSACTPLLWL